VFIIQILFASDFKDVTPVMGHSNYPNSFEVPILKESLKIYQSKTHSDSL